jgi:hypothetical protein
VSPQQLNWVCSGCGATLLTDDREWPLIEAGGCPHCGAIGMTPAPTVNKTPLSDS